MQAEGLKNKKALYENFWFVSLLAFALAFLFLLLHHHIAEHENPFMQFVAVLLKEAGFASLVAFFLNLSVEWVNRRRHSDQAELLVKAVDEKHQLRIDGLLDSLDKKHEETSRALLKNVFQTVYERNIEPGVFKVVDDHVLKKDVMRRGYKLSMTIRPLFSEEEVLVNDLVDLTFDIRYEAVNLTKRLFKGPLLSAQIDITPEYEDKCRFIKATIGSKTFTEKDLEVFITKNVDSALWTLVLPGEIEQEGAIPITLEYKKVGPTNYSEVVCTTVQMDSLEVSVLKLVPNLKVNAISLHPENEDCTTLGSAPELSAWKINHAILPGQGAVIFWHPERVIKLISGPLVAS